MPTIRRPLHWGQRDYIYLRTRSPDSQASACRVRGGNDEGSNHPHYSAARGLELSPTASSAYCVRVGLRNEPLHFEYHCNGLRDFALRLRDVYARVLPTNRATLRTAWRDHPDIAKRETDRNTRKSRTTTRWSTDTHCREGWLPFASSICRQGTLCLGNVAILRKPHLWRRSRHVARSPIRGALSSSSLPGKILSWNWNANFRC